MIRPQVPVVPLDHRDAGPAGQWADSNFRRPAVAWAQWRGCRENEHYPVTRWSQPGPDGYHPTVTISEEIRRRLQAPGSCSCPGCYADWFSTSVRSNCSSRGSYRRFRQDGSTSRRRSATTGPDGARTLARLHRFPRRKATRGSATSSTRGGFPGTESFYGSLE